jgi:hypothetical protein
MWTEFDKRKLESMRDLLRNGVPEWLVLMETVKAEGTVGNKEIAHRLRRMGWQLSAARLSQARKHLRKNGVMETNTYPKFYILRHEICEAYSEFFASTEKLLALIENKQDTEAMNALQKKGLIK